MSGAKKGVKSGEAMETDTPKVTEYPPKINVANLPPDVTEKQLRDIFSGHEVENVEIHHYNRYTTAVILFKDKETKTAALAGKDNFMFGNRRLRMYTEFTNIRYIKRELVVTVLEHENMTEEQLWDKVKAAGVEPTSVLIFYPLGYITLEKDCDKPALLEKLKAAGFNAHDVNQRDQNQHLDIWREAKLFFRNRNRVQLLNIPTKWIEDKEEMMKQCAEGGTITEAVSNNVTSNPQVASNYARIYYETEEQAAKAAKALNGRVVDGKRIHALHPGSVLKPNYKTSVYVTSLDRDVTEEQVYDHFKQFGEIDFTNRRNCGDAAIICFKNAASVEKALACITFPAPTEENKDATKEVVVKKYDGPLVLRTATFKRKLDSTEDKKDQPEKTKEQQRVLGKLRAFHPIYVGNVPLMCPPLELKHYFAQQGPIKFMFSPQILSYRNSAPHPVKTFIVYYINRISQQNAVRFFDHKFFGGHRLHVVPLRGPQNMDIKKTIKMTNTPIMSEDALFKHIKPFVGKINRIIKHVRSEAYIELEDASDYEKMLKTDTPGHPLPKSTMEQLKTPVSVRAYEEEDVRVLDGIAKIVAKNPDMLNKTFPTPNKRQRMDFGGPGFDQGPGGFNPNMNNPNAIQDLLRLAFMSGKNVGETLASNQSSFGSDPPVANFNNFGDGGFGNRNRNNQGGQGNFRGQGRMNMNQNQNRGNNAGNFGGNTNAGGNNFQGNPGNQNRGGQNMNRSGGNMNQSGGNVVDKPMNMNTGNQNRNNSVGGGNMNRNQNNRNFNNDNSFGGGNNFASDSFDNDNSFGDNSGGNFSSDNFGGNTSRGNNFGGNKRNQNDNFNSFGGGNNSGSSGGNNFNSNFNNRNNQNNRFDNDDNNFSGNTGGNFGNRQNKPFNKGGNQGGGMSFGNSNNSNRGNFGGNNSGGFNSGNAGGNKWNNSQSNTGSLAGNIFSRRF